MGARRKEEEDEGSVSSREGVSQASPSLPLIRLPPASQQLPICLISSPCSRSPAGAGGQGQTKASLLTTPLRKGLFFSPFAFLFKPLSPPLGPGPRAH